MRKIISSINKKAVKISQRVSANIVAPTPALGSFVLFGTGALLLTLGVDGLAHAQHTTTYNDVRVTDSVNAVLTYIEGSFGAMVMVSAGLGAILSSAFGQYRAALGLLVVAVGAFILRSLVSTFFNDTGIKA